MNTVSARILRISLAITFVWVGSMILEHPEAWGGYLKPWAVDLLPASVEATMRATGVADIAIGLLFLVPATAWIAGILGAAHMGVILVTSGITDITVRDIAILGASLAVLFGSLPSFIRRHDKTEDMNATL